MQFHRLVDSLRQRLRQPLPGDEAHQRMMPLGRSSAVRKMMEKEDPSIKLGGVLILLYPAEDNICFPLTLRHDYGGVHAGQISLPGGRIEDQDEDLVATALRETEEEIGVPVNQIKVVGSLSTLYIPPSRYKIEPVIGYLDHIPRFETDPREVKELFVANLDHLLDKSFRKQTSLTVRNRVKINTPYYDVHGQIVWGATGMILSEFAHIVEELI